MADEELKPLSKKWRAFVDNYFLCNLNATEAYMRVYSPKSRDTARANAADLLANPSIKAAIEARLSELHMSVEEALARETEIGRVGVGFFFKIVDEWMFNPLPEYEILAEQEVIDDTDPEKPVTRISYRVRHAVLDMDKVLDPRYAHLVKKFTNSRKTGLSIELYDGQVVHNNVLKMAGKFVEKHEHTGKDGKPLIPEVETMKPSEIAERVAALLKLKGMNGPDGN